MYCKIRIITQQNGSIILFGEFFQCSTVKLLFQYLILINFLDIHETHNISLCLLADIDLTLFSSDDVITLSSDDDEEEIAAHVGSQGSTAARTEEDDDDEELCAAQEEEEDSTDDPNDSGFHINDQENQPDAQGRVLVNVKHPNEDPDVFLAPQIARVIKPHQVRGKVAD